MNPRPPKISILMPSYNQGAYLEAAIQSVLSQDYPEKELIVVDGGSTDSSPEIIRKYRARLAYSVSEKDRGQAHALNKALPHATGEIIGWLNSDDAYLPGAFSKVAKAFQENAEAILVHGDRVMWDGDGWVSGWTALPPFDPATTGFIVCSETAFWRRKAAEGVSFAEDLRFAMDLDFFCRLYRRGQFVKLDSCLGAFRCHNESKSSTIHHVGQDEGERQWKKLFPNFPWRGKKARPSAYKNVFSNGGASPDGRPSLPLSPLRFEANRRGFTGMSMRRILSELKLYVVNNIVAIVPSHRFRLFVYRRFMRAKIGEDSSIFMGCWLDCASGLVIGRGSVINQKCRLDSRGGIHIGNSVAILAKVTILTADHDPADRDFVARIAQVTIEDFCVVGTGAMILKGVHLGRGAIVGAGSVVTKSIPAGEIWAGNPARKIGERKVDDLSYSAAYRRLFQ